VKVAWCESSGCVLIRYIDGYAVRGPDMCTVLSYSLCWELEDCCITRVLRFYGKPCNGCSLNIPYGVVPAFEIAFNRAIQDFQHGVLRS